MSRNFLIDDLIANAEKYVVGDYNESEVDFYKGKYDEVVNMGHIFKMMCQWQSYSPTQLRDSFLIFEKTFTLWKEWHDKSKTKSTSN
jgi:hypothetical protein